MKVETKTAAIKNKIRILNIYIFITKLIKIIKQSFT